MKKLISLTLALCLTAGMTACGNSDESSKTAELEKRVAELESQLEEQSTTTTTAATTTTTSSQTTTTTTTEKTTTTTTTAATTTPETTTTTAQTFDTSYSAWEQTERYNTSIELDLYAAPDRNAEILYTIEPFIVLDVCGKVNDDWLAIIYNDQVVFANRWVLHKAYDISLETLPTPPY